jgi:DNA polymerase I-like protein with 3'-5' exonuclease and polymerase domains
MSLNFIPIDIECTTRCPPELGFPGSPFYPGNRLLLYGQGGTSHNPPIELTYGHDIANNPVCFHNGSFDMHWARRYYKPEDWAKFQDQAIIWDTQIAEHILSSGRVKFASLDQLADIHKIGYGKSEGVSKAIKAGMIEDVPLGELRDYLDIDLKLTREVAQRQYDKASPEQVRLIGMMCESLKAIEEMEWNGMHVDKAQLHTNQTRCQELSDEMDIAIGLRTRRMLAPYMGSSEFGPDDVELTPKNLSALLFGGAIKLEKKVPNGVYKSGKKKGQPKFKWYRETIEVPSAMHPDDHGAERLKTGWYKVDESVLDHIHASYPGTSTGDMCKYLLQRRKLDKVMMTYYNAIERSLILSGDGCVHHSINAAATATGRYSSSNPNLQNVPMASQDDPHLDVKSVFKSRWGADGYIVEADYKQLEVVALAAVTQDPTLIDDLKNGRDIHFETGKAVFGDSMTEKQRRIVKSVNFGLIYGGGAKTLAEQSGVEERLVKQLINAFYDRYCTIKSQHLAWEYSALMGYDGVRDAFIFYSDTGRSYAIDTSTGYSKSSGGSAVRPNFTQVRNYPVQGLATGDLVPMMVGVLFRTLLKKNNFFDRKCLMINTVHDSIIFDIHRDVMEEALPVIKETLENAGNYMEEFLGCDLFKDLPLKVDIKYGFSWSDTKWTYLLEEANMTHTMSTITVHKGTTSPTGAITSSKIIWR